MIAILRKRSVILTLLGGLAIAVGLLSAFFLPERWRTASALAKEPQRINLHELVANGAGENPHVIVTDFTCGSEYVFEMQRRKGTPAPKPDEVGWGRAWIPLFPKAPSDKHEMDSSPTRFTVLLETPPTVASGSGFHILSRQQSMEGLVIPLAQRRLSAEVQSKLTEQYPDMDFKNCLVLVQYEQYEKEDAPVFAYALAIGAGGGLLVGLPLFLLGIILLRSKNKRNPS